MKAYNYLDLFHGIGGFALGAYWAGMKFENHYCSDIEPWCQKLYAKRFPDSIQLGDITKIDTSTLPKGEWIITGGFPCQDISITGKGAGIHGERSGLWFEYWRLINDLRPRYAIMENVGMLVHRGLREVLGSLAEIGYDAEWQDIRASDVGAPHRRERIWIVAYAEGAGNRRLERGSLPGIEFNNEKNGPALWGELDDSNKIRREMAHPSIPRLQGQEPARGRSREPGLSAECGDEFPDAGRELWESGNATGMEINTEIGTHGELYDKSGRPGCRAVSWSTEPAICGMADGLSPELHGYEGRISNKSYQRVDRLKGLGNAIVPQIAEILFRQIKELI